MSTGASGGYKPLRIVQAGEHVRRQERKYGSRLWALVVLAVVVCAALAAWLSGLIMDERARFRGCLLLAGRWTDDTAMALCLATSLVERRGFDARDQMERYRRWHEEGYLSSIAWRRKTWTTKSVGTTKDAKYRERHERGPFLARLKRNGPSW